MFQEICKAEFEIRKVKTLFNRDITIADFQRYIDTDRVLEIKKVISSTKFSIGSLIFVSNTDDSKELINIDGQHRLEALRQLYQEDPMYGEIEVSIQIIIARTEELSKYYYSLVNKNRPVIVPEEYFRVDEVKQIVNHLRKQYPKCFTDCVKLSRRYLINPNELFNRLSNKYELVSGMVFSDKIKLIMEFNEKIKNMNSVDLRKYKRDKTDIIDRARESAKKKGGLYLGLYPVAFDWAIICDENSDVLKSETKSLDKIIGASQRFKVWEALAGNVFRIKCPCCQENEITSNNFTIAHNIPVSKGGTDLLENLRLSCMTCNSKCGVKIFDEYCAK